MKSCLIGIFRSILYGPLETLPDSPEYFRNYRSLIKDPRLVRRPGGWLYEGAFWPDYLCVGGASHAIVPVAKRYCSGRGIDIGAGYWPLPGSIPVDHYQGEGVKNSLEDFGHESLDYVFSSHYLEHIEDPDQTLYEWSLFLRKGGVLFLYLPHESCRIWEIGSPFVGDHHRWTPNHPSVSEKLERIGFEIIDGCSEPDVMWSFFIVGKKP